MAKDMEEDPEERAKREKASTCHMLSFHGSKCQLWLNKPSGA